MIGTKIYKEYKKVFTEIIDENDNVQKVDTGKTVLWYDTTLYSQAVKFCNETQLATIEDKGEYYEVVEIPVHVPTAEEIQKMLTDGVENYMNSIVQERNYDNITTCIGRYYNSPVDKFRLEAQAVNVWVSEVWVKCYAILDEVKTGKRAIPTLEEVIAELPVLVW